MTAPELPLVSVCIPTYKRAELLRRAVHSLLACSYPKLEIIISDNASPDHTREVAAALCREDSRVRYFRQEVNLGATPNFEFARAQATGKYFVWHGDDDDLAPDFIAACVQALERDPGLVLAAGVGAYHEGDHVVVRYGNVIQGEARLPLARVLKYLLLVDENSIFCGLYRREAVARCVLPHVLAGDWAWVADVLMLGRARVLPHTYAWREQGGENVSASIERIVSAHGLPRWHGRHPWLAIPLNVANHLAFRSPNRGHAGTATRLALWLCVFGIALLRQVLVAIAARLPFRAALRRLLTGQRRTEAASR